MAIIKNNNSDREYYVNDELKTVLGFAPSKTVRVVGPTGEQMGLLTLSAALNSAYESGLDLVLMAAQADPPVCKIIDYGKFRFERGKREKEAKKKQQIMETKEIQLSCQIDTNDLNTKVNHARRFLTGGNKVKVIVKFKGRQMSHVDVGRELLDRFYAACEDLGNVDKKPVLEGRFMTMFITPLKKSEMGKKQSSASFSKEELKNDEPEKGDNTAVQE